MNNNLRNQRGESLMTVIIAVGIAGILILAIMTMASDMTKSLKYFSQKTDVLEMKGYLMQQLAAPTICDWQLATANSMAHINETTPASTPDINFTALYSGSSNTTPSMIDTATPTLSGLKVTSIKFKNFAATGTPGRFSSELTVSFDPTTLVHPLAPFKIRKDITFDTTAGSATARPILGCETAGGAAATLPTGACPAIPGCALPVGFPTQSRGAPPGGWGCAGAPAVCGSYDASHVYSNTTVCANGTWQPCVPP